MRGAVPSVFACLALRTTQDETQARRRKRSLPEHLDRVCERVTARRAGMTPPPPEFDAVLETITKEAAAFRDLPGPLRGETRERITARLVELDRMMLDAARAHADPAAVAGDARRGHRAAAAIPRSHARRHVSARHRIRGRSPVARTRTAADRVVRVEPISDAEIAEAQSYGSKRILVRLQTRLRRDRLSRKYRERLDVGGVREQIEGFDVVEAVADFRESFDVARQRRRVA